MVKFMGLMNCSWVLDGHDIATAFNLSGFQNIVDLGGGWFFPQTPVKPASLEVSASRRLPGCTGALAREVAKAFPSSSVTVFDLPPVVDVARKHFAQEDDAIAFQAGECRTRPRVSPKPTAASGLRLQPPRRSLLRTQEISSATSFLLLICTSWAESFTTGPRRSVSCC